MEKLAALLEGGLEARIGSTTAGSAGAAFSRTVDVKDNVFEWNDEVAVAPKLDVAVGEFWE
ncbi:hypothetical protein HPP92_013181 [Vanilla planifolia]|uniref:Uncharacterized protein n=1 Tax=Vanilla planifolia TaxID=51239 RepID=A0A835UY87_VANPL|nr:hypothetical protein HPP92_013181 [Vanilla planifolia]